MKPINDYFDGVPLTVEYLDGYYINIHRDILLEVIKKIQTDTIQETVQACADNADADITLLGWLEENKEEYNFQAGQDYEVYVIKSSILSVADKLIKELE